MALPFCMQSQLVQSNKAFSDALTVPTSPSKQKSCSGTASTIFRSRFHSAQMKTLLFFALVAALCIEFPYATCFYISENDFEAISTILARSKEMTWQKLQK